MDKILEGFSLLEEVSMSEYEVMVYGRAGNTAAAAFMKEKGYDLEAEVAQYTGPYEVYFSFGAQKYLIYHIMLPAEDSIRETNRRAMEGLLVIKKNKEAVEEVFSQLEDLFDLYEKTVTQKFSQFKENFAEKINEKVKTKINLEQQPGFQEEWMKLLEELNMQHENMLEEHKDKLRQIS
jgi:hypothetical protein